MIRPDALLPAPLRRAHAAFVTLAEALQPEIIAAYARKATGEKYLINPNKGV